MEYGAQPLRPYSPDRLSGYFDAFVQNTQTMHDPSTWNSTLLCLKNQKGYLEDLLSKTATTLNALRDKQTRNERALSTNPAPRTKKKKILQNRWRTDKTITTCENEERVILDCLQVCSSNISTLESLFSPPDASSTAAEYNSGTSAYTESIDTDFDWNNGWADGGGVSPFQRECRNPLLMDDIPPEAGLESMARTDEPKRPLIPPRVHSPPPSVALLAVPPNTAYSQFHHSTLSPAAACFEPSITHSTPLEEKPIDLDKLSISGLLATKRV
ncbi:hypothetical protein P154DRAFT_540282 [Amniculicola lignicola CBS 123094]|uniref:Uncharacterized protein n=1 Tax=Amniculicola lignicola CBS 123094 TaxID=1392246 RepID=A0A6A5VY44_9PLEO|nr:hypothetical protein P154DRAFT_540282 [Amniculicola lignicola CBS 123094]